MPLADHVGAISRAPENFGYGDAIAIEIAPITVQPPVHHHVPHAGLVWVKSGHQRRAARAASRSIIELREPEAILRQGINVRRLNLRTKAADVREAQVIRQDDHDIRPRFRLTTQQLKGEQPKHTMQQPRVIHGQHFHDSTDRLVVGLRLLPATSCEKSHHEILAE